MTKCKDFYKFLFYREMASKGNFPGKLDELEQGAAFLHENG